MNNFTENSMISWTGDFPPNSNIDYWTYPQVYDYYHYYYPIFYPNVILEKSKVDVAFKILKALQDKGVINVEKVKTFIELVDMISKEL
jgi:hypothetical protein